MTKGSFLSRVVCSARLYILQTLRFSHKNLKMDILDVLPADFGYAIFTFLYSLVMLGYLAMKVGRARKKYNVKQPLMHSDTEPMFNYIQRALQSTMEVYPQWLIFQLIAALVYPRSASVLGVIWVTSRFSHAKGMYSGDASKRMKGAYGYVGLAGVVILSIVIAFQLFGLLEI